MPHATEGVRAPVAGVHRRLLLGGSFRAPGCSGDRVSASTVETRGGSAAPREEAGRSGTEGATGRLNNPSNCSPVGGVEGVGGAAAGRVHPEVHRADGLHVGGTAAAADDGRMAGVEKAAAETPLASITAGEGGGGQAGPRSRTPINWDSLPALARVRTMTKLLKKAVKIVSEDHSDDGSFTVTVREERTNLRVEQAVEMKELIQSALDMAVDALERANFDNATMHRAVALCNKMGSWTRAPPSEEEQPIRRVRQRHLGHAWGVGIVGDRCSWLPVG